ncbi:hypothetical protein V500_09392 [Pseudogymnoascus sp. VKM F-4518 (FW-2643)]|nr:hypothetical protein V500_09392 [Pseudogymnoascus sp. VKM F-4518 (FW-2643)]
MQFARIGDIVGSYMDRTTSPTGTAFSTVRVVVGDDDAPSIAIAGGAEQAEGTGVKRASNGGARFLCSPTTFALVSAYGVMLQRCGCVYCDYTVGDEGRRSLGGAEVIKVEHPGRGDDTRAWGPPFAPYTNGAEGPGESAYYLSANRNKKSICIDFKNASGIEIIKKLAEEADILVENYLPGTLKKYGLDFETLGANNSRLIYASITGYGQTGPYSDRPGFDVMVEAEMGLMHITGERDGPPVKVGVAVTDGIWYWHDRVEVNDAVHGRV